MMNFKFGGRVYDFVYTMDDEAVVERFDKAEKVKNMAITMIKKEKLARVEENKSLLQALTSFIDEVLGENTCNETFKDVALATEILKLANTLTVYVANRMSEENTALDEIENQK